MKTDLIEKRIGELGYKMSLEKYAFKKAKYNLDNADFLGLTEDQTRKLYNSLDEYADRYVADKHTYDALEEYMINKYRENTNELLGISDNNEPKLLFKCTFPKEESEWNTQFQSSIIVDENVARLFANGVDYKEIVKCFDSEDIKGISTELNAEDFTKNRNGNVDVELAVGFDALCAGETPVVAKDENSAWKTMVASSKVPYCLSVDDVSLTDLNGKKYSVEAPSLDTINLLKNDVDKKVNELGRLMSLDAIVKDKVNTTISRMNLVLDEVDKYSK